MIDLERLRNVITDLITDSTHEIELADNIERFRMTLKNGSNCKKEVSTFKPRIHRSLNNFSKGIITNDDHIKTINSIEFSIIEIINNLSIQDFEVYFEYDEREGIVYQFYNNAGDLLYGFIGDLSHGKPNGQGKSKYQDGSVYEGEFKMGLRHGKGILFDKHGRLLKSGIWENDIPIEKGAIKFFPNIKAAASQLKGLISTSDIEIEYLKLPAIKKDGLVGFPVLGDSMEPSYHENDIVICKELNSIHELKPNKVYVIFHEDELFLKIIQKEIKDHEVNLRLISENFLKHQSFDIVVNTGTKIFEVLVLIKYLD